MLIETTKGMIEESLLQKETSTQEAPCGWTDSTRYLLDGEVVREDVNVRVKEGLIGDLIAGELSPSVSVKEFITQQYQEMLQRFVDDIGERISVRYPELAGMQMNFMLPGFNLSIQPHPQENLEQ